MKRFIKILTIIGAAFAFASCHETEIEPDYPNIYLGDAYNISATSATIDIDVDYNYATEEYGVIYNTNRNLTFDSAEEFKSTTNSVYLSNLNKGTTYYYRGYARDGVGQHIYTDEIKSFTTLAYIPAVSTGSAVQTGCVGIEKIFDSYWYFRYTWKASLTIDEGAVMMTRVGIVYDDNFYYISKLDYPSYFEDGKTFYLTGFSTESTSSKRVYYKACAQLEDGTYVYGDEWYLNLASTY